LGNLLARPPDLAKRVSCHRRCYNGAIVWPLSLLRRRKDKLRITREASFAAKPLRNPSVEWDEDSTDDELQLVIHRRKSARVNALAWMIGVPDHRKLVLDEMGTFVWRRCDGETSVKGLAEALMSEYKLSQREATVSLTTYLRTLGKRNLLAFAIDREMLGAEDEDEKAEEEAPGAGEKRTERKRRRRRGRKGRGRD